MEIGVKKHQRKGATERNDNMGLSFNQWILIFLAYSFLGWVCESIWCSIGTKKLVNRGFLKGPWCPIYGFGGIIAVVATQGITAYPLLVFAVTMVACSVLEYFTGWLLETLFKTTWWDYSKRKFNLKGRICLRNSLLFGLLGAAMVYFIHPTVLKVIGLLSPKVQWGLAAGTLLVFFADFLYSLSVVTNLGQKLEDLRLAIEELEKNQQQYGWYDRKDLPGSIKRLREVYEKEPDSQLLGDVLALIDRRTQVKGSPGRLLKAYPNMAPKGLVKELEAIKEYWAKTKVSAKEQSKSWLQGIMSKIQKGWVQAKASYKGLNLTTMIWVFIIGSVVGYVAETLWGYFITTGTLDSRQGLLYGPFSQIYGIGAVLMVLALTPVVHKGDGWLFGAGALIGGLYEALASLVQELAFGSVSWEYSQMPFSLFGGRTHLLYMAFWGILTIVYMKRIYPWMVKLINGVSPRPKAFFTWVISLALVVDIVLSAMAVGRWSQRIENIAPRNQIEQWIDDTYPNERMRKVYPHMDFISDRTDEEAPNPPPLEEPVEELQEQK